MSTDEDSKNYGGDRLAGLASGLVGAAYLTTDVNPLAPVSGVLSEVRDHLSLSEIIDDLDTDQPADVTGMEAAAIVIPAVTPAVAEGAAAAGIDYDKPVENGSGTGAIAVPASGDQGINGLLSGVRWNTGFITYSDPDSAADYQAGHPEAFTNFSQMSAQQMVVVHAALNSVVFTQLAGAVGFSVEGFTNLTIDYAGAGSGAGTIRVANTTDPGTAYAYYPNAGSFGGDAFFGPSGDFPATGNYDYHSILHELGHSLGLKHGQDASGFGAMPSDVDSMEFSVMTYRSFIGSPLGGYTNEAFGYAQTFMMYDIAALQYMYGADFNSNGGDTVYTWSPTTGQAFVNGVLALNPGGNRIFETIWDGNGIDTYNLSNYSTNLNIDLTPGGHSTFSSAQLANLGGGPNGGFARGNVFNALQFQGDARSLIENATGGSGADTITGNVANNTLLGNAGTDWLSGGSGNDSLGGGSGDDSLYGGTDNDTLDGGGGSDVVDGGDGSDTYYVNLVTDVASEVFNDALGGVDTVFASNSFTLGFGLENLYLTALPNTVTNSTGIGNSNANFISGNQYNNTLNGLAGADTIVGNAGNDTIDGGGDTDTVNGGAGSDTYYVNLVTDVVSEVGGSGDDIVFALGSYTIAAGIERLTLNALPATVTNSTGTGNAGANIINGNQYNNTLFGLAGNDSLLGNVGTDELRGGAGLDTLQGGAGGDILIGGTQADVFRLISIGDSLVGARDTIRAGDGAVAAEGIGAVGGDRFDFSAIDASSSAGGNQAFTLGAPGRGHLSLANSGGNTVISGYVNPGLTIDFQLVVEDGAVLAGAYVNADFIF